MEKKIQQAEAMEEGDFEAVAMDEEGAEVDLTDNKGSPERKNTRVASNVIIARNMGI